MPSSSGAVPTFVETRAELEGQHRLGSLEEGVGCRNASATVVTNDFCRRFVNRQASGHRLLTVGRSCTVALMVYR